MYRIFLSIQKRSSNSTSAARAGRWLARAVLLMVLVTGTLQGADLPGGREKLWLDVSSSNLRSGPDTEYATVTVVNGGQELELLDTKDDWIRVRTSSGKEGWLRRKAVTSTPPTPVVVKVLEKKLASIQTENEGLTKEIQRLADARQDMELESSKLKAQVLVLQTQTEELQSLRTYGWAALGILILLLGWAMGYVAGVLRRQADDRRYDALKREAASRKG